ncbi:hypothetical protein Deba_2280 [Desulfarculus baarsii DSM 2075]|uniref:Uncharacterized protein n=1 Tax=Desulfarculus baarsii (strain ATCC 33931 / DSM 2075 / LMG 7858 / VKM B-1802 / 2st14) TaxID=644282 RepID=E1QJ99_DESB2|nr:hypothetical protein [Desulfarculus baarsii]ADK85642.1 hypothetical protein Deba_2280 [Desulfarculus baarsii DSM 2075]
MLLRQRIFVIAILVAACCAVFSGQAMASQQTLIVKKITELGTNVFLTDGSEWKVPNPDDWDVAYNWLPGHPVRLLEGNKIMLNLKTGERINVKLAKSKEAASQAPSNAPVVLSHPALSAPISSQQGGGAPDALTEKRLEKLESGLESLENKLDILLQRMQQLENRLPQQ